MKPSEKQRHVKTPFDRWRVPSITPVSTQCPPYQNALLDPTPLVPQRARAVQSEQHLRHASVRHLHAEVLFLIFLSRRFVLQSVYCRFKKTKQKQNRLLTAPCLG